jgi:hypothetical protein
MNTWASGELDAIDGSAELRISAWYRHASHGRSYITAMISGSAADTTLRLTPTGEGTPS